jgi:hypothetical protein
MRIQTTRSVQIDNGQYGDVKLDGAKYGLAGEFTQKIIGEPIKQSFVAYYMAQPARYALACVASCSLAQ